MKIYSSVEHRVLNQKGEQIALTESEELANLITRLLNEDEGKRSRQGRKELQTAVQKEIAQIYFDSVGYPIALLSNLLFRMGYDPSELDSFNPITDMGRHNFNIGSGFYLSLQWYKMESGNWEVTGYIS